MRIRIYFSEIINGNCHYEDYIASSFRHARTQFFEKHNWETHVIKSAWEIDDFGVLDKKLYPIIPNEVYYDKIIRCD